MFSNIGQTNPAESKTVFKWMTTKMDGENELKEEDQKERQPGHEIISIERKLFPLTGKLFLCFYKKLYYLLFSLTENRFTAYRYNA